MSQLIAISGCDNSDRQADVVYVHGLGGDAHATWRHGADESASWPHWLGMEFPDIGVWLLDYAASPTRRPRFQGLLGGDSSDVGYTMALPDRALQVLNLLIQRGFGQRSIMFICHSMGGLLVKQLLRKANESNENRIKKLAQQTNAVLFLATPHSGAKLASIADSFRGIFGTTVSIEELREHNAHLRDLYNWYRNNAQDLGIETVSYYENRSIKGLFSIVNPTSAQAGVGSDAVALDEDHLSISKPRDRDAQVYRAALDLLQNHVLVKRLDDSATSVGRVASVGGRISSEESGKLLDIVHKQANVIEQLTGQKRLFNADDSSFKAQGSEDRHMSVERQPLRDKNLLKQIPRYEELSVTGDVFVQSREKAKKSDIAEIVAKLDTADDIAEKIHLQLAVWNYDTALVLSGRLEEHLKNIDISTSARLKDYLFLMARVHVIHAEKKGPESAKHIEHANDFLIKIDEHLAISPQPALAADVYALRGSIEKIQNGEEAALGYLSNCEEPYAIRIRLAIYLRKNDLDEAVKLIEGRLPHLKWCDLGVAAYAAAGRRDEALALVDWVGKKDNKNKYPQCVVFLAEASLIRALANQEPGKNILPQNLRETERVAIQQVLKDIEPVLSSINTHGCIDSELATLAVKIGWQAHYLLGHQEEVSKLVQLMSTRTPVQIDVARSVMSGFITPSPDLSQRLRNDYPDNLNANILAAVIESNMGQHETAFESAKKLLILSVTNEDKEELFKLFQHLSQLLDGDTLEECERIAHHLVDHKPQLQAMLEANRLLRDGKGGLALDILDKQKTEDDAFWLQLRGEALKLHGRIPEAVEMFQLAARQMGTPMLLHKAADLAFQTDKVALAVKLYEELVAAQPGNLIARSNLASLYTIHLYDIGNAAIQFEALHDADPENSLYTVNLALCFSQLYRPDEALVLYDEACKANQPDLRAVLGRSELYLSLGNPDAACDSLKQFRDLYWDNPDFLLASMNTAYAAGDEGFANEVLIKLNKLISERRVDEKSFRMVHTDEAVEMFKESVNASEDIRKNIHQEMLKGHMPWVLAAQAVGHAVYWAWRLRTQKSDWMADDPINRANYSVYSTNGFHPGDTDDGMRALVALECPPLGTSIVADLSALITLHRLGLLDIAADYFGEIFVPQQYLSTVLEDGKKMVLHQRSRQRTADEINRHVADGGIVVLQNDRNGQHASVDEYLDADVHRYHLIDVITPIHKAGHLDDLVYERVKKVCIKPSGVDDEHPPLETLQDVHFELLSLETLTSFGLLDRITKFYRVNITSEAHNEIKQRLDFLRLQEETRVWHFDLWNRVRNDNRFRFVRSRIPQEMSVQNRIDRDFLGFQASFIAQEKGIPLLVDDRASQAMTLNERQGATYAAFGSDAVVLALSESDRLDDLASAEAMLTLMRWRYRFIVPTAKILKTYAIQYRMNPPGISLREVAEYVHDCMRDMGLFAGIEKTDSSQSMAIQLYISWLKLLAEFLVTLRENSCFPSEAVSLLTDWCVQECMPSQPQVVPGVVKARMGALAPKVLITHMLLSYNSVVDDERVSDALMAVKAAMQLSDEEYLQIVTEILNDIKRTNPES